MVLIDSISIPTTFHQPCAMRRRVLREGAWAGPTVRRRGTAVAAAPATSATAGAATAATTTAAAAAATATVVMSLLAILPPFESVRIFPHFSFLVLPPQHCKCVLRRTLTRHLRTHAHRPPASFPSISSAVKYPLFLRSHYLLVPVAGAVATAAARAASLPPRAWQQWPLQHHYRHQQAGCGAATVRV